MKYNLIYYTVFLLIISNLLYGQQGKDSYLKQNAIILTEAIKYPKSVIIGFGAYHGSAATEDAEIKLLTSLLSNNDLAYYFAETDISIAHYFNEYLETGNEELLKDLVITYGVRIPQESTKEVFNKWKKLKALNDKLPHKKRITVLGADPIVTYKYTYRHLLSLINNTEKWNKVALLKETVAKDTTDYSPYYDSYAKNQLKDFVADYEVNSARYESFIKEKTLFNHLIATIKVSFTDDYKREKEMYNNYNTVCKIFNCRDRQRFFRLGFSHLLKAKTGRSGSFFSMLIENHIHPKDKIVSVIGYLTHSEVFWNDKYDDNDNFVSSVTKGDDGIGDLPTEYFKGIALFKEHKKGNFTLFPLNKKGSPYSIAGCTDMVEVVSTPTKRAIDYGTNTTTDFLDYVLLISNSPASMSIYAPDVRK